MAPFESQLAAIALRKERMVARAGAQRTAIRQCFAQLHGPIAIADRGLAAVRFLRAHPMLVAVAVAAVVVLRGRGLLAHTGRAFSAWRAWRLVSAWASGQLV